MNNADSFTPKTSTRYQMLKLENGDVAFAASPGKSKVTMEGVAEEVELEVTETEWHELRTKSRQGKLDFAAARKAFARRVKPDRQKPLDTIKE